MRINLSCWNWCSTRLTVSRDVFVMLAISSWVSATIKRRSLVAVARAPSNHSSSNEASLPATVLGSAKRQTLFRATRYSRNRQLVASAEASGNCFNNWRKSLTRMAFTRHNSAASAVVSWADPLMAALMPRISPGPATRRMAVRPSRELTESLTRPESIKKTQRGVSPSTKSISPRERLTSGAIASKCARASFFRRVKGSLLSNIGGGAFITECVFIAIVAIYCLLHCQTGRFIGTPLEKHFRSHSTLLKRQDLRGLLESHVSGKTQSCAIWRSPLRAG